MLGDALFDRSLLDGEFDEFFLQPLHRSVLIGTPRSGCCAASTTNTLRDLGALHRKIDVPVQLVWGEHDRFFPVEWARTMVADFAMPASRSSRVQACSPMRNGLLLSPVPRCRY